MKNHFAKSSTAQIIKLPVSRRSAVHTFTDLETASFDVTKYSEMKFGSGKVARLFGEEMANNFFFNNHDILVNNRCVVVPAPSTTVPVAATLLSRYFMNRINKLLAQTGKPPVEWTMVHRDMTYNNNYADLPKEERVKLLAGDSIYINQDFVDGKFIIFIDDCSITGTHEEKISSFLDQKGLANQHLFLCYAQYLGDDPAIEMRLNHHSITDARDLVQLAYEDDHHVTTRSLRLLLEYPETEFGDLLESAPRAFLEESFNHAIVKGYNLHPAYIGNFTKLSRYNA